MCAQHFTFVSFGVGRVGGVETAALSADVIVRSNAPLRILAWPPLEKIERYDMSTKFILEDVVVIDNNFSADSRDKDGLRVVTYEARRAIKLHLAIDHIVHIEVVKDSKQGESRSIVSLTSDQRYITRRSAQEVCAAIEKAGVVSI
jgi:hypothetical protein